MLSLLFLVLSTSVTAKAVDAGCNTLTVFNDLHRKLGVKEKESALSLHLKLMEVKRAIPELVRDRERWKSLYVDYETPFVHRLWLQLGEYRVYLHKIEPIESSLVSEPEKNALFHTHNWKSIVQVISGRYEMGVGYGPGIIFPPVEETVIVSENTIYSMTDPDDWHYVLPLEGPVYTLMIAGPKWDRETPTIPQKALGPLNEWQKSELFQFFEEAFPLPTEH